MFWKTNTLIAIVFLTIILDLVLWKRSYGPWDHFTFSANNQIWLVFYQSDSTFKKNVCFHIIVYLQSSIMPKGSPSRVRLCPSCLRRFGDLRKNTPRDFWSMYLVDFVFCCQFQPPQALCVCVAAACGASVTTEKTCPWIFGAWILCILSFAVDFRVPHGQTSTKNN